MEVKKKSAKTLAEECNLDFRATLTLLYGLVSLGFLEQPEPQQFQIIKEAQPLLVSNSSTTMTGILGHHANLITRWVQLESIVRTGIPISLPEDPKQFETFIRAMADVSRVPCLEVAQHLDLSNTKKLLDLGGGPATASIAFAKQNPSLECTVFDFPEALAIAHEFIENEKLLDRIHTQPGNYFINDFGSGYDVVYASNIIHSLDDEQTFEISKKAALALKSGGKYVIKEFFVDETRTAPLKSALFGINMLLGTQSGKVYTIEETKSLMKRAGFGSFEVIELAPPSQLLIGILQS